jgi:hypothetical protein
MSRADCNGSGGAISPLRLINQRRETLRLHGRCADQQPDVDATIRVPVIDGANFWRTNPTAPDLGLVKRLRERRKAHSKGSENEESGYLAGRKRFSS